MKSIATYKKIIIAISFFLFTTQAFSQDPNFHIYLSFGQSNMEGQGDIEGQDQTVDSRFQTLQAVNCTGQPEEQWRDATPPLARCGNGLGPSDYFGRTMVANSPDYITTGIVVVAVAGCDIGLFDKVNYANFYTETYIENAAMEYGGSPYARLVELGLIAQQAGVIKGILLHQGETNSGQADWPDKVKAVYDNLLSDLSLNAADVPLLVGEVVHADQGGICAGHNNIIANIPSVIPTAHVISSSGCTDQNDNLHFNSAGYRVLGERYANQMLTLISFQPSNAPVVTITLPSSGSAFSISETVTISADVTDSDNNVTNVEYYVDGTKVGESSSAPYSFTWTNSAEGEYSLQVIATDADNNTGTATITLLVRAPQTPYGGTPHAIPGTIQFEDFDDGGQDSAYYDTSPGTSVDPAVNYRADEDVDIEDCTDTGGGYNLGYTIAGEWLEYTVTVAGAGTYDIDLRVASDGANKTLTLAMDGTTIANDVAVPNTGGWQTWETVTITDVTLVAGTQIMRVTIGAEDYVNMNYIQFTAVNVVTDNCPSDPNKTEPGLCGCGVVEGTCTPIEITLKVGWNLVGYPHNSITTIETAFAPIWSNIEVIKNADAYYLSTNPPELNLLQNVNWGQGYFVKVTTDCTLVWGE